QDRQLLLPASVLLASGYLVARALIQDLRWWSDNPLALYFDFSVASACYAIFLVSLVLSDSWLANIMRLRVLRSFGKYSYTLYLYHMFWLTLWMQLVVAPAPSTELWNSISVLLQTVAIFSISWCFAYISWKYFEMPLLRLKDRVSYSASLAS
ncbi:MAG TPA: acyltransferase family protein, partial [Blastocatellia bacterium]|nr:acyltransferase family protein [Blastocatellia bacterium]